MVEVAALPTTYKGADFASRRDFAILCLFRDAGMRLSELAGLELGDDILNLRAREPLVTRMGSRQPFVQMLALDRPVGLAEWPVPGAVRGPVRPGPSGLLLVPGAAR
jgi:site-specific recombinase XerC